jgi:hypothetical protein
MAKVKVKTAKKSAAKPKAKGVYKPNVKIMAHLDLKNRSK